MHKDPISEKNMVKESKTETRLGEFNTGGMKEANSLLNIPQSPTQKQNKEPDREANSHQAHIKELNQSV